jgi:hypothetical protein
MYLSGYDREEIADLLGWPEAKTSNLLYRGLADLRNLGVVTTRAAGFLALGGRRLGTLRWAEQLGFWQPDEEAGTAQMIYEVSPGTFR